MLVVSREYNYRFASEFSADEVEEIESQFYHDPFFSAPGACKFIFRSFVLTLRFLVFQWLATVRWIFTQKHVLKALKCVWDLKFSEKFFLRNLQYPFRFAPSDAQPWLLHRRTSLLLLDRTHGRSHDRRCWRVHFGEFAQFFCELLERWIVGIVRHLSRIL